MKRQYDSQINRTTHRAPTGEDTSAPIKATAWEIALVWAFVVAVCSLVSRLFEMEQDWVNIFLFGLTVSLGVGLKSYKWLVKLMWTNLRILQASREVVKERAPVAERAAGPVQPQLALTIQNGNTQYRFDDLDVDRDLFIEWGAAIVNGDTLAADRWNKMFGQREDNTWIYSNEIIPRFLMWGLVRPKSATSKTHGYVPTRIGWLAFAKLAAEGTPPPQVIQDHSRELAPGEPTDTDTPGEWGG